MLQPATPNKGKNLHTFAFITLLGSLGFGILTHTTLVSAQTAGAPVTPEPRPNQAGDKPARALSYTEEQSMRGEAAYTKSCGFCHDDKSMAPPLQGDTFLKNWSDKSAGALFDKIQITMPLNEPGTLPEQQSADLVAYILKLNHFPAGQEVLPKDPAVLGALSLSIK